MAEAQQVTQNVSQRYLKKDSLQTVLERLFPGQTEFRIRVRLDIAPFSQQGAKASLTL